MSYHSIIGRPHFLNLQQFFINFFRFQRITPNIIRSLGHSIIPRSVVNEGKQRILVSSLLLAIQIIGDRNRIVSPKAGISLIIVY